MESKERFSCVRKHYGLSMSAFGERIGLSASGVSAIEYGTRAMSDKHIKLICAEFPEINEDWLRGNGGDMVIKPASDIIDPLEEICKQRGLSPLACGIVKGFVELPPDRREEFLTIARKLFSEGESAARSAQSALLRDEIGASQHPSIPAAEENPDSRAAN